METIINNSNVINTAPQEENTMENTNYLNSTDYIPATYSPVYRFLNMRERVEVVKALEIIALEIKDLDAYDKWVVGCAESRKNYEPASRYDYSMYKDDNSYKEILSGFLEAVADSKEKGGLEDFTLPEDRATMVRAMETIARCVNDEGIFMAWLEGGVADGDIQDDTTDEELEYYTEDEPYEELKELFVWLMYKAWKDGGLYTNGVCSRDITDVAK